MDIHSAKAGAAETEKKKPSFLRNYGPTVIIVGFFVYQWISSWAKSSPMFQKAWEAANEQARQSMPEAYEKAGYGKKGK